MTGLSLVEYTVLVRLSESDGALRMTELAHMTCLSASRMTRLIESLQGRGLVEKRRACDDGRGFVAAITDEGLRRLKWAYPMHLASARTRVVDHFSPVLTAQAGPVLAEIAEGLTGERSRGVERASR
jgi:DNA-binding MarR family transcriptional regulator